MKPGLRGLLALARLLRAEPDDIEAAGPGGARRSIGRYWLVEQIGSGGAGIVWKAWDTELRRWVALKEPRPDVKIAPERFLREAQSAAGLAHPNLVTIHDYGQWDGGVYIVMELVDGEPLDRTLDARPPADRATLAILEKVARGVHHAHEQGVVHRDLKPGNILVTRAGEPKVGDFGLVHLMDATTDLTRTGTTVGTPLYMAPEQVEGKADSITPRTDIYALGAVLYQTLTGRTPHAGESLPVLFDAILHREPTAPRRVDPRLPISRDLETIALRALEKRPERRYPSAGALADDLASALRGEPIKARPATLAYRASRQVRKRPLAFFLGMATLCALILCASVWLRERAGRGEVLRLHREKARIAVDAALELRRVGANSRMRNYLPDLQASYRVASERAPRMAELDYAMGRMYRALMNDGQALEFQEKALLKDPEYAPALYERAILLSKKYGQEVRDSSYRLLWVHSVSLMPKSDLPAAERARPELARMRLRSMRDCEALARLLTRTNLAADSTWMTEANLLAARGILAYYRGQLEDAESLLREAVKQNPQLEEAWEHLAKSARERADAAPDPEAKRRWWNEAERIHTEALAQDQGYVEHLVGSGTIWLERALAAMAARADARLAFQNAERDFTRALTLEPDYARPWELRGNAQAFRVHLAGPNVPADFHGALADLTRALELGGASIEAWIRRAIIRMHYGNYIAVRGEDPRDHWAAAEKDFARALELDPGHADAWIERGLLRSYRARYRLEQGGDPIAELDAAQADYSESLRLNPQSSETLLGRAEVFRSRARYWAQKGAPERARADEDAAAGDTLAAARIDPAAPGE